MSLPGLEASVCVCDLGVGVTWSLPCLGILLHLGEELWAVGVSKPIFSADAASRRLWPGDR